MNTTGVLVLAMAAAVATSSQATAQSAAADNWDTIDSFRLVEGWGAGGRRLGEIGDGLFGFGHTYFGENQVAAVIIKHDPVTGDWVVKDDQLSGGPGTEYMSFASDPSNPTRIYAGGRVGPYESASWFISRSEDRGETWVPVSQFSAGRNTFCSGIAVDGSGTIYAVGQAGPFKWSNDYIWLVYKSTDHGTTWKEINRISGLARAAAYIPQSKSLFVAGKNTSQTSGKNPVPQWSIRRSTDAGASWTTVGAFAPTGAGSAMIDELYVQAPQTIYACGWMDITTRQSGSTWNWLVRRSTDNGQSWTTLDMFKESRIWGARSMAIHPSTGAIYVIGGDDNHWLVRKSSDDGRTWSVSDLFAAGGTGQGILVSGHTVLTTGFSTNPADGRGQWIIRALSLP
jgi:hypothetical protein